MFKRSTNISVPHAFSTRNGGASIGDFCSLNLGFSYGDKPECVAKNWDRFCAESGVGAARLAAATQVHKADVAIVDKDKCISSQIYALNTPKPTDALNYDGFKYIFKFTPLCMVDGLITADIGVSLAIFTADCASLLLHDNEAHVSAALHCGWKSFTTDIIAHGLQSMEILGAKSANIHAAIGPCINKCCFEVGIEVVQAFDELLGPDAKNFYKARPEHNNKFYADLPGAVSQRLIQLGIARANIDTINECTSCDSDKYFSYRAESGHTGRLASVIENV